MATRRERVVLELEDRFTPGIASAAAHSELLARHLDRMDKGAVRASGSVRKADRDVAKLGTDSRRTGAELDRFSGRLRVIADVAAILGPAFVPIGAAVVPAVTALSSALGFAAVGAGTAVIAFQGVGDALDAVNKAALEPTADNLNAATRAMADLSPEARTLVTHLHEMIPELKRLRDAAAGGLFPGVVEGLDALITAGPRVERVLSAIGGELGDIAAETGRSLASDRWADFIDFIGEEGPDALADMASAAGSLTHGLAELWMAFDPLNDDLLDGLTAAAGQFDEWATSLKGTDGFIEFIDYVRDTGPQMLDTVGSIGNALLQIAEAAAPLGGPTLHVLEDVADVVAAIADSDIGTPLVTLLTLTATLNRTLTLTKTVSTSAFGAMLRGEVTAATGMAKLNTQTSRLGTLLTTRRGLAGAAKGAALLGGLGLAASGVADKTGLANAATGALIGSIGGPLGTATGFAVGALTDLAHANDDVEDALRRAEAAADSNSIAQVKAARAALEAQAAYLATSGAGGNFARAIAFLTGEHKSLITQAEILDARLRELQNSTGGVGTLLTQGLAPGVQRTASAMDNADRATEAFLNTLDRFNARLNLRAALRANRQALRDFTAAVKENGKAFDTGTAKADKVQAALDEIAKSALIAAEQMHGAQQATFLAKQRKTFMSAAITQLGITREEAGKLATRLGLVDRIKVAPKITVDTAKPKGKVSTFDSWLQGIASKPHPVKVSAETKGARDQVGGLLGFIRGQSASIKVVADITRAVSKVQHAFGNIFGGGGHSEGGYTGPGGKFEPAGLVHRDEFVFSKEATHGNVGFLEDLHRQLRGYAGGGYVGQASPSVSVAAPNVSVAGAQVRVLIDGREVRAIVQQEAAADRRYAAATAGMRPA